MAKTTPKVQHNRLHLDGQPEPVCEVGSPAWFGWLEEATTFRYHSSQRRLLIHSFGPLLAPISLRKEKRRRGYLWYAYRRRHGILHKRYVGKSEALTKARLEEIASILDLVW